jgi:hypothetical protein
MMGLHLELQTVAYYDFELAGLGDNGGVDTFCIDVKREIEEGAGRNFSGLLNPTKGW